MNKHHYLKILPKHFKKIQSGDKTFEVRFNDRNYKVGDYLHLQEWTGHEYTGGEAHMRVPYILDDSDYLKEGFVVMSIERVYIKWGSRMTIEELKHLRESVITNTLAEIEIETLLELIDTEIARQSVTDEDVDTMRERIERKDLQIICEALQQMQKEPCEYCNGEMEQFFEIIDANFCMRCGRKLR